MNITLIGGGTGTSNVLEGLKRYGDLNLSVIVGMMDDGGSNSVIRDEFGLLPLSDLRKSIIALSGENENNWIRDLFTYRFTDGDGLKGHTLGNLLMIAMTDITGSEIEAIEAFKYLFSVRGSILPVTLDDTKLVAEYDDGTRVEGEHLIDEPEVDKSITKFYLSSKVKAYEGAVEKILESDFIVIGPGDMYTTTLANIIVPGIAKALQETKAKLIFIPNLMSKIGQTRGLTQKSMLEMMEEYVGRKFDFVLINNGRLPEDAFKRYIEDGEEIFKDDLSDDDDRVVLRGDLVANSAIQKVKGDTLTRSLVRHEPKKLGEALYKIFRGSWGRFFGKILTFYK